MIKTIKIAILIFSGFLATFNIYSQPNVIQGHVYDKNSNKPLPHAHIVIKGTSLGTITNTEGYFRYIMPENFEYPVDISVSYISYISRNIKIKDSETKQFSLEQEKTILPEVVITGDFVFHVLQKAFNNIPDNYPDKGSRYKGFLRQTVYHKDTLVYMGEAFMDAYKSSYKRDSRDNQIELLKFRKFRGEPSYEDSLRLYGGPFITYSGDFVKLKAPFLNPDNYNIFDYEYNKVVNFQNEEHFKINFKHKSAPFSGRMLINKNNFAYSNIVVESNQDSIADGGFYRGPSVANAIYYRSGDIYFLKNIDITIYATNINTCEQFIINAIYTATDANLKDASPIDYKKTMPYRDIFMDSPVDTSKTFWNNYNIIENDSLMNRFISHSKSTKHIYENNDLSSLMRHTSHSKGRIDFLRVLDVMSKFSFEWGGGVQWINSSLYPDILSTSHNNIETGRVGLKFDSKPAFYGYFLAGYNFSRVSSINIGISSDSHFGSSYKNHGVLYLYRNRIKHYGRPIFLDTGTGISFFRHEKSSEFSTSNEIFVNDNLDYAGVRGSSININTRLTIFPARLLAVIFNAQLDYAVSYEAIYKYNNDNASIAYKPIHVLNASFSERLMPSITIGLKYYIRGGF